MVNMKDISEVPLLEQLTGKENVLLNDSGSAKQTSIEILFADTSKALEESVKTIEALNKKIEEMEELDIDIVVRGTWSADEENFIPEVEVNKMLTFEELKQKILAGTPLKVKAHLFSQEYETGPDDPYAVGIGSKNLYEYAPAGFYGDNPEYIEFDFESLYIGCAFFLEANNELILLDFYLD